MALRVRATSVRTFAAGAAVLTAAAVVGVSVAGGKDGAATHPPTLPNTTTKPPPPPPRTTPTPIRVHAHVTAANGSVPKGAVRFILTAGKSTFRGTVGLKNGSYTFTSNKARAGTFSLVARYFSQRNTKNQPLWQGSRSATKTLTLGKAKVSIAPDGHTIAYGQKDPTFTYTVTGGKPFSTNPKYLPTYCGVNGVHSDPANYRIQCVYADTTNSFDVTTSVAVLEVTRAPLTVVLSPISRADTTSAGKVTYHAIVTNGATCDSVQGLKVSFSATGLLGASVSTCSATTDASGAATCSGSTSGFQYASTVKATIGQTTDYAAATQTAAVTS